MDLSIIIPSHNTERLLDRCLSSIIHCLKNSALKYEIIVIDNASNDDTIILLKNKYPRVIRILNKDNLGYGKANNQGINKAKGTHVLLLNSDIVALDDSISSLYSYAKTHPNFFIGGKLLNDDGSHQSSCGPMYTLPVVFILLFAKGDQIGITRYSPLQTTRVAWVSGACLIGLKKLFIDVGLFDENIFMYMDEIEFFYRAQKKGYSVQFYPYAQFIHTGAASSHDRRKPVIHNFRGLLYFYKKHRSIIELRVLTILLKLKAYIAILTAKIMNWPDIISMYEEALRMV